MSDTQADGHSDAAVDPEAAVKELVHRRNQALLELGALTWNMEQATADLQRVRSIISDTTAELAKAAK